MKIEKIHVNKIKVTFTPEDLIEHNLSAEAVKNNSPRVQNVLMSVVKQAQEETGFCAENARLMVEAMPAEDDCMVMYITRLDSEDDFADALNGVKRRIRLRARSAELKEENVLISFENFDDAVKLAKFAQGIDEGELYFHLDRYHLIAKRETSHRFAEFGKMIADSKTCDLIREHGKKVCDNALATLREYF